MTGFVTARSVIRCRDFQTSKDFYGNLLGLEVVDQFEDDDGIGCIYAIGHAQLEIYEMNQSNPRFDPAFQQNLKHDKVELQIQVDSVDMWADKLEGVWPFEGPEDMPWGQRWMHLHDPDSFLIAFFQDIEV